MHSQADHYICLSRDLGQSAINSGFCAESRVSCLARRLHDWTRHPSVWRPRSDSVRAGGQWWLPLFSLGRCLAICEPKDLHATVSLGPAMATSADTMEILLLVPANLRSQCLSRFSQSQVSSWSLMRVRLKHLVLAMPRQRDKKYLSVCEAVC